jgi:mono/diheme cytochrome c family protein
MKKTLKWIGSSLCGLAGIATLGALYAYFVSEKELTQTYNIALEAYRAPTDHESIRRGERLATMVGCANSCHGKNMEGRVLFDEPGIARIIAPNLPKTLREYSDPELLRLLRKGLKRDGTTTWAMPSAMFAHISEEDLGDIIAYVRNAPEQEGPMRETRMRPFGRLGILLGQFTPVVKQVDPTLCPSATTDASDPLRYGEYLVKTTCSECHGQDLKGHDFLKAPDLLVAQAYSDEAFFRLMRTGLGLGNRHLGKMTEVSTTRFVQFTDDEVRAIKLYLGAYAKANGVVGQVRTRLQANSDLSDIHGPT